MNKIMSSVLSVGAGIVAYNYIQKNNLISNRQRKKLIKGMKSNLLSRFMGDNLLVVSFFKGM